MAYIGKTPVIGNFQKCDSIAVVNGQAAYTLQVGGTNVSPQSENHMLVSLNGILQAPVDSFTVSGSTLTFASNLVTGDVIDFVMILGNVLDLGVPSDNTVSLAKLTATGTKDATTFLRGDNTFAEVVSGLTVADQWRLTANTNYSSTTDLTSNLERVDTAGQGTIGSAMTESSGVFTFPSTGIYLVNFHLISSILTPTRYLNAHILVTTNNSSYSIVGEGRAGAFISESTYTNNQASTSSLIDVTDTSNVKVKFQVIIGQTSNNQIYGSTSLNLTTMTFIRLGDT